MDYTEGDLRVSAEANELEAGMDPSAKGEQLNGWSPLIFTAKEGHVEMARLLLKHGANSLHKDRLCLTALDGEMVA